LAISDLLPDEFGSSNYVFTVHAGTD
jgi:hypothetical protein